MYTHPSITICRKASEHYPYEYVCILLEALILNVTFYFVCMFMNTCEHGISSCIIWAYVCNEYTCACALKGQRAISGLLFCHSLPSLETVSLIKPEAKLRACKSPYTLLSRLQPPSAQCSHAETWLYLILPVDVGIWLSSHTSTVNMLIHGHSTEFFKCLLLKPANSSLLKYFSTQPRMRQKTHLLWNWRTHKAAATLQDNERKEFNI